MTTGNDSWGWVKEIIEKVDDERVILIFIAVCSLIANYVIISLMTTTDIKYHDHFLFISIVAWIMFFSSLLALFVSMLSRLLDLQYYFLCCEDFVILCEKITVKN